MVARRHLNLRRHGRRTAKKKRLWEPPSRCADAGRQGGCQTVGALLEHRRFEAIDHRLYLFVLMQDLN
ncbi:hypothetical protein MPC4_140067 [Methylocella tundrae]|uniref:Uncharacterized protein n=1 Tax=Methylocella tundrae TaxID=227605 RepID=A0A8B6M2W7_METTU|nr:hypothetical protein MPC4_140067 [Methylocella tundrae]